MKRLTCKIIDKGPLTARETDVLRYLSEGYSCPEIARRLFRSVRTIEAHRNHIAEKLGARGGTEIVIIAQHLGLVKIELNSGDHALRNFVLVILSIVQLMGLDTSMRRPPRTPKSYTQRISATRTLES